MTTPLAQSLLAAGWAWSVATTVNLKVSTSSLSMSPTMLITPVLLSILNFEADLSGRPPRSDGQWRCWRTSQITLELTWTLSGRDRSCSCSQISQLQLD